MPAAASARPGFDVPVGPHADAGVTYGSRQYDAQNQKDLGTPAGKTANVYVPPVVHESATVADKTANVYVPPTVAAAPKGDTKNDIAPVIAKRHVAVPGGKSAGSVIATVPVKHTAPAAATADDGTDGWKIATLAEAGLIAAIAIGGAVAVAGRARPRRTVTA